ncbi:alcohol dehydrogenase catalytic domain-containing protein [Ureibacillus composti]|nr:alcohol dehydrogenase catalytic domain-containing protein [Ureibacillus composti]
MELQDVSSTKLKKSEVRIQIKACGLNNKDLFISKGVYFRTMSPPLILGSDIAGVVLEVGEEVSNFSSGDRVVISPIIGCGDCQHCLNEEENKCIRYVSTLGGLAEEVVISQSQLIKIPEHFDYADAAALPIAYLTAWNMLYNKAKVTDKDTVLFWGGTSGVGTAGILLFNQYQNTIAIAGSEEKVQKLKSLGVKHVINYKNEDVYERVMALTKDEGVDVIFDPVGKAAWSKNLDMLKNNGRHVNCARSSGAEATIDLGKLFAKQIAIYGAKSGTKKDLQNIIHHLERINKKPIIDKTFSFHQAKEALHYLEHERQLGKVVVTNESN